MAYPYYPNYSLNPQLNQPYYTNNQHQSGFVLVQSEQDVRSYPVAPGNSIPFKVEGQPCVYIKTMSLNPMEGPTVEKYKLVKENTPEKKDELASVWAEIDKLNEKIRAMEVKHEPTDAEQPYRGRSYADAEPPATKPHASAERDGVRYSREYDGRE